MNISTRRTAARRTARLAVALSLAGAGLAATAGSASAATGGTVTCYDQSPVVGVWINVSGGTSGWASRSGSGFQQRWSYNTQGRSYSVTVGCGGTPARWAASTSTPYYSTSWSNLACFPGYGYGFGSVAASNRCYAG